MAENVSEFPICDRDISDTVDRPCSFIDIDDMRSELCAVGYVQDSATIEIYTFVENLETGFLALLTTKNKLLEWLNNPIVLDVGGVVTPTEVNAEISKVDKALRVSFNIDLVQALPRTDEDTLEDMENLNVEKGVN